MLTDLYQASAEIMPGNLFPRRRALQSSEDNLRAHTVHCSQNVECVTDWVNGRVMMSIGDITGDRGRLPCQAGSEAQAAVVLPLMLVGAHPY